MGVSAPAPALVWHDLECGGYRADVPLWLELAGAGAPAGADGASVLDLGAGSGRVTAALARAGHRVTALDLDPVLLQALSERTRGLPVRAVLGDARDFALDERGFDLCLVPMQTLQLLRGSRERAGLFACAAAHLRPGGVLACAIVTEVDEFDGGDAAVGPAPDRVKLGTTVYVSRPVRVRRVRRRLRIERERMVFRDGEAETAPPELDAVELELVGAADLAAEMRAAGLEPLPSRSIPETGEHSGSEVVIARA